MPGQTPILKLPYPLQAEAPDGPVQIKALADALDGQTSGAQGLFILGEVRFIAVTATPGGWLLCDGAVVSRATYAKLFGAIGTVFGAGDGSTTFTLPDLRGRAPVGAGQGAGLTNRVVGTKWGVEAVVLSVPQLPSHDHSGLTGNQATPDHAHSKPFEPGLGYVNAVQGSFAELVLGLGSSLSVRYDSAYTGGSNVPLSHQHSVAAQGGGQGHDNTPPSVAIPAYIYAGA